MPIQDLDVDAVPLPANLHVQAGVADGQLQAGGVDLRSDEGPADALGLRAFVEVERRASVGAEVRYERWMARNFGVWADLTGTFAPQTLFGGGFGCTAIIPFGKKVGLFIEPSFQALPLGSDTPGDGILIWGLLSAGVRFGL